MKKIIKIFLCFAILTLIACESQQHISVTVVDKDSGEVLDSVFVQVNAGKNGSYDKNSADGFTDENGKYETYMMIGCSFGCYDIQMSYSKSGYKNLIQLNNTSGTISLEKE